MVPIPRFSFLRTRKTFSHLEDAAYSASGDSAFLQEFEASQIFWPTCGDLPTHWRCQECLQRKKWFLVVGTHAVTGAETHATARNYTVWRRPASKCVQRMPLSGSVTCAQNWSQKGEVERLEGISLARFAVMYQICLWCTNITANSNSIFPMSKIWKSQLGGLPKPGFCSNWAGGQKMLVGK